MLHYSMNIFNSREERQLTMTILQNITKRAKNPQKIESAVIFSESLEEEGKVSWAAEISKHVVEETDSVQNLGLYSSLR